MSLLEPLLHGAIISYVVMPIAAYALGFDPSLSWQYVLAFGALPLVLAFPAMLQAFFLSQVLSGDLFRYEGVADLAERIGLVVIVVAISVSTYFGISHWIHAPVSDMDKVRLALASPFIGGVAAALAIAASFLFVELFRLFSSAPPART
jgi:hypothetical protein